MPLRKSKKMIEQILLMASQGHKLRKISRSLGISRNTVRRYLREAAVASSGEKSQDQPAITAARPSWALVLPWEDLLKQKQRGVSLKQLYSEYEPKISYSRFCRVLAKHSPAPPPPTAARLVHQPGDKAQIDFSDGLCIKDRASGRSTKTQLFCGVLPFSSYTYAEFVADQKLANFIRCHENMWAFFGGVTPYVIVDNLKSGVAKAHRYDPDLNPTYCDYSNHAGFAVLPARPYTPRDKAAVEAAIGVIQRSFYQQYRDHQFYSLEELNLRLREFLQQFNETPMRETGVSRSERFLTEREKLLPVQTTVYEIFEWRTAKVHPDCCIQVSHNFYSVPYRFSSQQVRVKVGSRLIEITSLDGEKLACHVRASGKGNVVIDDAHMPPRQLQESSFELRKAKAKAAGIGPSTKTLIELQLSGDRPLRFLRRVQGILRLIDQGGSRESLEYAASQALTFKRYRLSFIKGCMNQHMTHGGRPRVVAPQRDPKTIHLHGE